MAFRNLVWVKGGQPGAGRPAFYDTTLPEPSTTATTGAAPKRLQLLGGLGNGGGGREHGGSGVMSGV